ncbi:amidase [Ochrobactrum chromiisoli]|uniref:Indoleacetamide hydrolase n=1 Tax=Ochrobactrum chromiisoli TaxID=2993941 RepID=A0ABT3QSU2_9HYPH|nr:amidase [Ochrobactrum chromiisoli]MCX2698677.1 amidase [Ochrobactrum chromiisoli]
MKNNNLGLTTQIGLLADGTETACSLAEKALDRAEQHQQLNAFVTLDRAVILAQATAADKRRQTGQTLSVLDGIPIAVKDNYLTRDFPTTACSHALPSEPENTDATIIANLRKAGVVIFGKTNMHEWAYGATNTVSSFGMTRNPHNISHITGGSSGGSAVAVACGIVAAALGSDTGGSVRIPAAACGIYGYKPSYGRASRHGILPLSWSLDTPGPLATSLDDIELLLPYFFGMDSHDLTTRQSLNFQGVIKSDQPRLLNLSGAFLERSALVDVAINGALSRSNSVVMERELDNIDSYFSAWEAILHSEASSYHQQTMQESPQKYSPMTLAHLEAGNLLQSVDLLRAQRLRAHFQHYLLENSAQWDALVLPTLPVVAPKIGDEWQEFSGRKVTTQDSMTWFCWIGNLSGLPCITLPVATDAASGLPIGLMLMGKPGKDEELLSTARWVDNHLRRVQ